MVTVLLVMPLDLLRLMTIMPPPKIPAFVIAAIVTAVSLGSAITRAFGVVQWALIFSVAMHILIDSFVGVGFLFSGGKMDRTIRPFAHLARMSWYIRALGITLLARVVASLMLLTPFTKINSLITNLFVLHTHWWIILESIFVVLVFQTPLTEREREQTGNGPSSGGMGQESSDTRSEFMAVPRAQPARVVVDSSSDVELVDQSQAMPEPQHTLDALQPAKTDDSSPTSKNPDAN
jgi:hypothetical protein